MMSRSHSERRWYRRMVAVLATAMTVVIVAPSVGAHVPPPVWTSPDLVIDIPDVPLAMAAVGIAVKDEGSMWTVDADGIITTHGAAEHYGDLAESPADEPIVGIEATPTGLGYWLAASDGAVFAYGDAPDLGDVSHLPLDLPIVGMARTSTGNGFWLVASDGGIFTVGDAEFHGSAAIYDLVSPIVAMSPTSDDSGYWLGAGDGGVFTFGEATFFGSMGAVDLDGDVVSMAAVPDDGGYWLAGADGGIFTFGSAAFDGAAVGEISGSVSDMAAVGDDDYVFAVDAGSVATPVAPVGLDAQEYYDSLSVAQIAIWDSMADCESGERWDIDTGNGYYGGLQFSAGSWGWVGGVGLPHQSSRIEQIYRGARLQAIQGWGAWPGCARRLGLI